MLSIINDLITLNADKSADTDIRIEIIVSDRILSIFLIQSNIVIILVSVDPIRCKLYHTLLKIN